MENFLIKSDYHLPIWKMSIIWAFNIKEACAFACVHARTDSYSLFSAWKPAIWFGQNDLWSHLNLPHTLSDSLQRKNEPSPEVSILAKEVGKGGTTLTKLVTRPGHGPQYYHGPQSWAGCHGYSPSCIFPPPWEETCLSRASRIRTNCFLV